MTALETWSSIAWGPWSWGLVLFVGVAITVATFAIQVRGLVPALIAAFQRPGELGRDGTARAGMGALVGVTAAVWAGGPAALLWFWIAMMLAMACSYAEAALAHARPDTAPPSWPGRGSAPRPIAILLSILTIVATLAIGGLLAGQQTGELLETRLFVPRTAGAIAIVAAVAVAVAWERGRSFARGAAPWIVLLYVVVCVWGLASDPEALAGAFARIGAAVVELPAVASGVAGGATAIAIQQGVAREALADETGLGSAATVTGSSVREAGLRAMLGPLFGGGVIGTLSALVLLSAGDPRPRAMAERDIVPLERPESRGLRPSRAGQTIVLPLDTDLEAGKRYAMVLRSNPRGHKFGRFDAEDDSILVPTWGVAIGLDTVVLRDGDETRRNNPGWDVRIPVDAELMALQNGVELLRVKPRDSTVSLRRLMAQRKLDGPYLVLDDFAFVGDIGKAWSSDTAIGEHLAMLEAERPQDAVLNPKLRELFTGGFRGPYADDGSPRPPWALVGREGFEPEIGTVVELQMVSPPRGALAARIDAQGQLELPPWDFLAAADTAVIRHREDTELDLRVPIRGELHRDRLRFVSDVVPNFDALFRRQPDYVGVHVVAPPYRFSVEVRGDTRLPAKFAGRRALVPLHPRGEPEGPEEVLPYMPHPGEVLTTEMSGPHLAGTGAASLAAEIGHRTGGAGLAAATLAMILLALAGLASLTHFSTVVARAIWGSAAARVVPVLQVAAAAAGVWATSATALAVVDLALVVVVVPRMLGLLTCLPRIWRLR